MFSVLMFYVDDVFCLSCSFQTVFKKNSVEIVPAFHIIPPQLIGLLMRNTCAPTMALTLALSGPHKALIRLEHLFPGVWVALPSWMGTLKPCLTLQPMFDTLTSSCAQFT